MALKQVRHGLVTFAKRLPHRLAPSMHGLVARGAGGRGYYIGRRNGSSFRRERECRPQPLLPRKVHVHSLDLLSGKLFFDLQIQPDECKGYRDRLSTLIGVLSRECIHHMLMNERRIAPRQRVAAQLVIGILLDHMRKAVLDQLWGSA
jgi:hypothetical protein